MALTTRCRLCKAWIRWERTINHKPIPLDAEPNPDGNVVIWEGVAHVIGNEPPLFAGVVDERWMPHHATFPAYQ